MMSGIWKLNLNLFYCLLPCRLNHTDHKSMRDQNLWNNFRGVCRKPGCGTYLQFDEGIFCANFYSTRGGFAACKSCWCPSCFGPTGNKPFMIRQTLDDEGEILDEGDGLTRYVRGRAGDHLMVPFQCGLCHFRNIYLRIRRFTIRPIKRCWNLFVGLLWMPFGLGRLVLYGEILRKPSKCISSLIEWRYRTSYHQWGRFP